MAFCVRASAWPSSKASQARVAAFRAPLGRPLALPDWPFGTFPPVLGLYFQVPSLPPRSNAHCYSNNPVCKRKAGRTANCHPCFTGGRTLVMRQPSSTGSRVAPAIPSAKENPTLEPGEPVALDLYSEGLVLIRHAIDFSRRHRISGQRGLQEFHGVRLGRSPPSRGLRDGHLGPLASNELGPGPSASCAMLSMYGARRHSAASAAGSGPVSTSNSTILPKAVSSTARGSG